MAGATVEYILLVPVLRDFARDEKRPEQVPKEAITFGKSSLLANIKSFRLTLFLYSLAPFICISLPAINNR